MINEMKWGWFKVPVKGEQMNAYLFSDTTKINKNKKWTEDESIATHIDNSEKDMDINRID